MEYTFYITGYIGWEVSKYAVRNYLDKCKGKHCDVNISSMGGDVDTALDIYEQFRNHGDVTVYITGCIASSATIIAMGAKHIVMSSASAFLIHKSSSAVTKWSLMNEEEIGDFIKNLEKQQRDQRTIDGIIANIYSLRNQKKVCDNLQKMSNAAWMNAQDALDFGLIDEISNVPVTSNTQNSVNQLIQNIGLPALPDNFFGADEALEGIADKNGNPTTSFLQKTVQGVKALFHNNSANNEKGMIKTCTNVGKILNKEGFTEDSDNNVALTQVELKTLDDRISALETQHTSDAASITSLTSKVTDLEKQITEKDASLKEKDEQIKNLQGSSADHSQTTTTVTQESLTVKDIYDSIRGI